MSHLHPILIAALVACVVAHSQMTEPQPNAPMSCRVGGPPQPGLEPCPGPCDLTAEERGFANHASPADPARTYSRGQRVTIKYTRNNHPPGGFMRLTLVNAAKKMDKSEHEKNAFYYSCWGANAVRAAPNELGKDKNGYSMIGSDSNEHNLPPGYYTTSVTIPDVVPDGDYVLGWAWYGGVAGGEIQNNGPATKEPATKGFFSDYRSCAYVRIEGGAPLADSYVPVFDNDMSKFSTEGCMSANDALGVCPTEPCSATAKYQKPRPFANGRTPRALTPSDFGGANSGAPGGESTPRQGPPMTNTTMTQAPTTSAPMTQPPKTSAPMTQARTTRATMTEPPMTEPPMTETPMTEPPMTAPQMTEAPMADPEMTEPPMIAPQMTEPPMADPQMTEPPMADPEMTGAPTTVAPTTTMQETMVIGRRSCKCLGMDDECWGELARRTKDYCKLRTSAVDQPTICKESCCAFCEYRPRAIACRSPYVKEVCKL